jgi:hypothetical protein
MKGNQYLKIKQIEAALRAARGNVMYASEMLNRTRAAIYDRISKSEHLQKVQQELLEEELDLHEGKLRTLGFDKDNVTALLAFLNARGKERGYGRQNVEVKGDVGHKHEHTHRRVEDLTEAEIVERWRQLTRPRSLPKPVN